VLGDDVPREDRSLLGGGRSAEALPHRDDVVVDRLGQPDDGQLLPALVQEVRQVGRGGVGVVAADGVQDVDPVPGQPVAGHLQRVLPLGHQPALEEVLDVGQLDPAVADRAAAEAVQQVGVGPDPVGDLDRSALQQSRVPVEVGDDLHLGDDLAVPLDQAADGRGQARCEPTGGEQGDTANGHGCSKRDGWRLDPRRGERLRRHAFVLSKP
jgi:hypothetical protein